MLLTRCRLSLFAITIIFSLLLGALLPRKWGNYLQQSCDVKICAANIGIHSDIIVPIKNDIFDWQQFLSLANNGREDSTNYRYLSFGWGDRDFYMQSPTQLKQILTLGFQALFFSDASVIRVQLYQTLPRNMEIKCVGISKSNYLNLIQFIKNSFRLDNSGVIKLNYNSINVKFYAAKAQYSILQNSNNWTAAGLQKAQVNTPIWAGLSTAIMLHLNSICNYSYESLVNSNKGQLTKDKQHSFYSS